MRVTLALVCGALLQALLVTPASAQPPGHEQRAPHGPARGLPLRMPFVAQEQKEDDGAAASRAAPPAAAAATETQPRGFWIFNRTEAPGPMTTDRPGFSDSYALVERGYTNFEFGYTFLQDRERSSRTSNHTLGEFSLRTGLTDEFELRVKWAGFSFTESLFEDRSRWAGRHITTTDHDDGGTDMSVGFKSPLLGQKGLIPNLSIIPAIALPTGTATKSSGDADPSLELAWNYALTDRWAIYGVAIAAAPSDGEGHYFQSAASLATCYQFTPKLGAFLEYYGIYPSTRDSDCQHSIDFGPVILLKDNLQIDLRAGFGLDEEAPDFIAGVGFSFRF